MDRRDSAESRGLEAETVLKALAASLARWASGAFADPKAPSVVLARRERPAQRGQRGQLASPLRARRVARVQRALAAHGGLCR